MFLLSDKKLKDVQTHTHICTVDFEDFITQRRKQVHFRFTLTVQWYFIVGTQNPTHFYVNLRHLTTNINKILHILLIVIIPVIIPVYRSQSMLMLLSHKMKGI